MNRRQLLRTVALAGGASGATAAVGSAGAEERDRRAGRSRTRTPNGTATEAVDATPAATETPTTTEAVATPTAAWEPLGAVGVSGATETVLGADGETAFVAVGDGFATLSLSDTADPTVLARVTDVSPPGTDRVLTNAFDVKYDSGELLLAGPAGYQPDSFRGVVRYDVGDPAAPELVDAYETTFPVHNCYFADGVAYLTGNDGDRNPLVVVDLDSSTELARWSVLDHDDRWAEVDASLRRLHDVWVQDGLAYLAYWDAGVWILDVSDPADPAYRGSVVPQSVDALRDKRGLEIYRETVEPPGNAHYVATDPAGELLAVGGESWNSNAGVNGTTPGPNDPGGPSGIDLYDVGDPAEPTELATIDPPPTADPNVAGVWTTAHNFDLGERYLYSSWYQGGLQVHDLSDPTDPRQVRQFRRSSTTSFWTAQRAPGGPVVATSRRNPAYRHALPVVFTFPDVPREKTPTPTDEATTAPAGGPATGAPTATTTTGTTAGDGPGFGPLAALAGLGVGAWRSLAGADDR